MTKDCVRIFRLQEGQGAGDIMHIEVEKIGKISTIFQRLYCMCMAAKLIWRVTK